MSIDKVKDACESAKQNPAEENSFRQLRLNQLVKQAVRWMPMAKCDACTFAVDPSRLEGRVCYGGLDLSSTIDVTAFVLVFPPEDSDGKYEVLPFLPIFAMPMIFCLLSREATKIAMPSKQSFRNICNPC